ncbi:MAG: SufD family Fe-S cluster assembly protein [Fervidicoccaceae archaeon]
MMRREAVLANIKSIPYQSMHDSPTMKYYTSWKLLEESLDEPRGKAEPLIRNVIPGSSSIELLPDGGFTGEGEEIRPSPLLFNENEGRIMAAHFLLLNGALLLKIAEKEEKRLMILDIAPQAGSSHHHVRLEMEPGSKGEVVIASSARSSNGAPMLSFEVLMRDSELRLWKLSRYDDGGLPVSWIRVHASGRSKIDLRSVAIGGKSNLSSDEVILQGSGESASIRSFLLARNGEKVDYITNVINDSPEGKAEVKVRGFNFGGSVVHRGRLKVAEEAVMSENVLSSIVYKISDGARSYSIPSLEVENSEVLSASHETSVSPIPEGVLFYLRSRGLSEKEAIELLVRSSALGVLEELNAEGIITGLL